MIKIKHRVFSKFQIEHTTLVVLLKPAILLYVVYVSTLYKTRLLWRYKNISNQKL